MTGPLVHGTLHRCKGTLTDLQLYLEVTDLKDLFLLFPHCLLHRLRVVSAAFCLLFHLINLLLLFQFLILDQIDKELFPFQNDGIGLRLLHRDRITVIVLLSLWYLRIPKSVGVWILRVCFLRSTWLSCSFGYHSKICYFIVGNSSRVNRTTFLLMHLCRLKIVPTFRQFWQLSWSLQLLFACIWSEITFYNLATIFKKSPLRLNTVNLWFHLQFCPFETCRCLSLHGEVAIIVDVTLVCSSSTGLIEERLCIPGRGHICPHPVTVCVFATSTPLERFIQRWFLFNWYGNWRILIVCFYLWWNKFCLILRCAVIRISIWIKAVKPSQTWPST